MKYLNSVLNSHDQNLSTYYHLYLHTAKLKHLFEYQNNDKIDFS